MTAKATDHYVATQRWIEDNPKAYALFRKYALELAKRRTKIGIGLIAERVRWEAVFEWGKDDFKINNNYRAYIARRLVAENPELEGKFEFRAARNAPSLDDEEEY